MSKIIAIKAIKIVGIALALAGSITFARAETVKVPQFLNPNDVSSSSRSTNIRTIRFLTTNDFPPFNFIAPSGELEGLNVALARAVCFEIKARCTMQAVEWEKLDETLQNGQGDAIIAGVRVSEETLERYVFSKPYLRFPARFFTTKQRATRSEDWMDFTPFIVGVQKGTAHEAFLRDKFDNLQIRPFETITELRAGVLSGAADIGFTDGVATSFWLQSANAKDCCQFVGGAYFNIEYFGNGMSVAVPRDRDGLRQAIDEGLRRVVANNKFQEIYLRYFPVDFFESF